MYIGHEICKVHEVFDWKVKWVEALAQPDDKFTVEEMRAT